MIAIDGRDVGVDVELTSCCDETYSADQKSRQNTHHLIQREYYQQHSNK